MPLFKKGTDIYIVTRIDKSLTVQQSYIDKSQSKGKTKDHQKESYKAKTQKNKQKNFKQPINQKKRNFKRHIDPKEAKRRNAQQV